jgi:acyl-CoA thioester hydrolase
MSDTDDEIGLVPRPAGLSIPGLDLPEACVFFCDLLITPRDLSGAVEHVSNVQYVRWLDRAAQLHADSLGYSRRRLLSEGVMWFVARHEIDYLAEAHLGDELVVATWVRDLRRVKSWRDYVVVRPGDGTIVCRAATLWVLVDLATRRPTRIPAEMTAAFAPAMSDVKSGRGVPR